MTSLCRCMHNTRRLKVASLFIGGVSLYFYLLTLLHQSKWTEKLFISQEYIGESNWRSNFSIWQERTNVKEKSFLKPDENISNRTSCEVVEFLASLDPSFRTFEHDTLCDDVANYTDILCRIYLRQIGVNPELESESCYLKNFDLVPKIVFFVTFGELKFEIWNYIAVVAAHRHVQPTALYIIGDQHPRGPWWELVIRDVPGLRFIYRETPAHIAGRKVLHQRHLSDIVRLQVLYLNGGIYLDTDMVVLKNLDTLLGYDFSAGILTENLEIGNAFLISKRRNAFIKEWYQSYSDYKANEWTFSMATAFQIYKKNKSQVNLIPDLYRPNWFEIPLLINASLFYDWTNQYAIHIWTEHGKLPKTLASIQTDNSTVGQVFRFILYGDSKPRK